MWDAEWTIEVSFLYTTENTFKVIVVSTTSEHGKVISTNIDSTEVPEGNVFLFLMKDGG